MGKGFGYYNNSYQGNQYENQGGYNQTKPENRLAKNQDMYQEPGYAPINVSNFLKQSIT